MEHEQTPVVTLRQIFTLDKPLWNIAANFSKHAWQVDDRVQVRLWAEFSVDSINAICGELLDRPFPSTFVPFPDPAPYLENHLVQEAEDLNNMASWLQDMASATIPFAAAELRLPIGGDLLYTSQPSLHWYGIENEKEFKALAVGFNCTTGGVFDFGAIREGRGNDRWTCGQLEQLRQTCIAYKTNYGFLITENQLVLVQCAPAQTNEAPLCGFRVMPVPLYGTGESGMTAELGFAAFCTLALVDEISRRRIAGPSTGDDIDELITQFDSIVR